MKTAFNGRNQQILHMHAKHPAEGIQMIHGRKNFSLIPSVDRLRTGQTGQTLNINCSQVCFLKEFLQMSAGCDHIDWFCFFH